MVKFTKDSNVINNLSEEEKLILVRSDCNIIEIIDNPSLKIQEAAVMHDGRLINCIKDPSEYIQILSVKLNGYNIAYIEKPTIDVQKLAMSYNKNCYCSIKNPCDEIKHYAIAHGVHINEIENATYEMKKQAVIVYPRSIIDLNVDDLTDEIIDIALKDNYIMEIIDVRPEERRCSIMKAILARYESNMPEDKNDRSKRISSCDDKRLKFHICNYPSCFQYIINPSEEIQKTAIYRDKSNLKFIKNPSIEIQKYAIDLNVNNLFYLTSSSLEIKIYAIKKGLSLMAFVNPTPEMIHEATEVIRIKNEKRIIENKIDELKNLLKQIS